MKKLITLMTLFLFAVIGSFASTVEQTPLLFSMEYNQVITLDVDDTAVLEAVNSAVVSTVSTQNVTYIRDGNVSINSKAQGVSEVMLIYSLDAVNHTDNTIITTRLDKNVLNTTTVNTNDTEVLAVGIIREAVTHTIYEKIFVAQWTQLIVDLTTERVPSFEPFYI